MANEEVRLPEKYHSMMQVALIAAAAVGPLGVVGSIDAVAVIGTWGTLLYAMMKKAEKNVDKEMAKTIAGAAVTSAALYWGGCKIASTIFAATGLGIFAGMGISSAANIVFTYRFGCIVSEMIDNEIYSWEEISKVATSFFKQIPSIREVSDIVHIYKSA